MSNHHNFKSISIQPSHFGMHFRNQRASRIKNAQTSLFSFILNPLRHAVRAINQRASDRNIFHVLDKNSALSSQSIDNELIVNNLMLYVDRGSIHINRSLDNFDRSIDSGTKTSGIRKLNGLNVGC